MPNPSRSSKRGIGVSVAQYRQLCLSMPQAVERSHMGTADFRAGGKGGRIFATLYRQNEGLAMVKLQPPQQRELVARHPEMFAPIKGGWGRMGATEVRLRVADEATLRSAIQAAWRNVAPPDMVENMIFRSTAPRGGKKLSAPAKPGSNRKASSKSRKSPAKPRER